MALSELLVSLPLLAIALPRLGAQHRLTPAKCVYVVFLAALLGAMFALLFWLIFTRPARKMRRP